MNEFCEANDLIVRNDRVRVVGFGKSVSQRAVHGSKRYVKKQGGGSGTSGGTAAKKNKAETESNDKIQTVNDILNQKGINTSLIQGHTENTMHYVKGKKTFNINFGKTSTAKSVTEQLKKELSDEYDKFVSIFGELYNIREVEFFPYDNDSIYGGFNPNSGIISIYGAGGKQGKAWLTKVAKEMKKKGMWSTGSPYHAYRHELAHALQDKLSTTDPLYKDKLEKISVIRKNILDGLTNLEESDIIEVKKNMLSEYGLADDAALDEFISECVAEYCNGKPRAIAKSVVDILLS